MDNLGSLGSLVVTLAADMAAFQSDMGNAQRISQDAMNGISESVEQAKHALVALGAGFGVHEVIGFVDNMIEAEAQLGHLSEKIGISVQDLAAYKLVALESGTTVEQFAQGIKKLSTFMVDHADRLKEAGITAKTADGAMIQLADIFHNMPDGIEKTALTVAVFGRNGLDMISMLNKGSEGLQAMVDKGRQLNPVTEEMAAKAQEFNEQLSISKVMAERFGMSVVDSVLPVLKQLVEDWNDVRRAAADNQEDFSLLAESLRAVVVLGGNTAYVFKEIGAEIGGMAAQLSALSHRDMQLFSSIGAAMKEDAAKARADIDAWSETILNIGKKKPTDLGRIDAMFDDAMYGEDQSARGRKLLGNPANEPLASGMSDEKARRMIAAQAQALGLADQLAIKLKEQEDLMRLGAQIMPEGIRLQGEAMAKLDNDLAEKSAKLREERDKLNISSDIYNASLAKLSATIEAHKAEQAALIQYQQELNGLWEYGAAKALQAYIDDVDNVAKHTEAMMTNAFKGMEDALVNFVKTGKLDFKSMADSIIGDLVRMQIQANITRPLAGMMQSGTLLGSTGTGSNNPDESGSGLIGFLSTLVPHFASGTDYVSRDMLAVVHKGEAIVPASQNNGSAGGVAVHQTINIDSRSDQGSILAAMNSAKIQAVAAVQASIKRGGSMAKAARAA